MAESSKFAVCVKLRPRRPAIRICAQGNTILKYDVNVKSIMGIFRLDLNRTLLPVADTDDIAAIAKLFEEFLPRPSQAHSL